LTTAVLFLLLFGSCGIEVYYSLEPPSARMFVSGGLSPNLREFSFYTNDAGNVSSVFKGTDVYYKLYNNLSDLNNETASINAANAEYSSNGYNSMASRGYRQLDTPSHPDVLFPQAAANRTVLIRLFDEAPWDTVALTYDFPALITVSAGPAPPGIPARPLRRAKGQGFDFYIDSYPVPTDNPADWDDPPVQGDSDALVSSSPTAANRWYVCAYAVSVGQDTYLTPLYSQLLHLGYIQIE
jgi:hypothetical protein